MKPVYSNKALAGYPIRLPIILWFGTTLIAVVLEISRGTHEINNFLIYKGVYEHTIQQINLYATYPLEYADGNHYGPLFSLLIAPFTWFPISVGCVLWCMANAWVLFYALQQLNLSQKQFYVILLISVVELMTATHSVQFNPMLAGSMILSYTLVRKNKILPATLLIAAGMLIKIYSIIGLVLFLFTDKKKQFAFSFLGWVVLLFMLPMLISSKDFIIQSYQDWFHSLVEKNGSNIDISVAPGMQDISVGGMIRRIFYLQDLSNFYILIPAAICIAYPLTRYRYFFQQDFTLTYFCMLMVSVVIFSSSAESPTYIIPISAIAIWLSLKLPLKKEYILLLSFTFLFTILSPTDLMPKIIRDKFFVQYAMKALPCFIIWIMMIKELSIKKYLHDRRSIV
ncbi:MAG: DUF2029 domain-containing protein [Chitinophagaceae bacterium]|nr:DUF2029 domain-containing protein [Chitinophagaceae bacterium]